jgi:sulfate/thiosulfate transport system substrate-binding protein
LTERPVGAKRTPTPWLSLAALGAVIGAASLVAAKNVDRQGQVEGRLLNVSYDPTRELYEEINRRFVASYAQKTGQKLTIEQSHGGSATQARAIIDGLPADIVTLALYTDIDALRERGLVAENWMKRLPRDSLPYTSTIVFVVRHANPLQVHDWPDLVRPGVAIVTPDPRTSGNGKLSLLAAWGSVIHAGGDDRKARSFVSRLCDHVALLSNGAREATVAFSEERIGDVQLTWENEAVREVAASGGELEIVHPSISIRAEPFVAWVDANVDRRGTKAAAQAYLAFLYTKEAQEIIARHGYRPTDPEVLHEHASELPAMEIFPVTAVAKDWNDAQQRFFSENGLFDVLCKERGR